MSKNYGYARITYCIKVGLAIDIIDKKISCALVPHKPDSWTDDMWSHIEITDEILNRFKRSKNCKLVQNRYLIHKNTKDYN